jgi:hypothetical protein
VLQILNIVAGASAGQRGWLVMHPDQSTNNKDNPPLDKLPALASLLNLKVCRTNAQLCQILRHIERQA